MPDIFLSYNREDQTTAQRFAEAFAAEGFEVWWDTTLRAGEAYDEVTENALKTAKAVVVLWSPRSVVSRWVRAEATLADRNKTLVPVTIESCERPIMFELTQTADLSGWNGSPGDAAWLAFLGDVKRFVQIAPPASTPQPPAAGGAKPEGLSICVLPFANMSGDPEQEYFADGISEDIITDLSKVSALSVISRNTAFTFKGRHVDVPQVGRQLKVTHVVEGSVRKAGQRVRITAQLIDTSRDNHLWAERWDRNLDDIFALQDEISEAIVGALKLKLLPDEKKAIEDRGTTNVEAYDLYLRARVLTNQFGAANLGRAVELFREALKLDPEFLQGWSGLATALINYANFMPGRRSELLAEMDAAAQRMVEIAPQGRLGLHASAFQRVLQRDYLGAEQFIQRAPPSALSDSGENIIHRMDLVVHDAVGHASKALEGFQRRVRLDPLSLLMSMVLQQQLDISGEPAAAQTEYIRSLDLAGDREIVEFFAFLRMWGRADPPEVEAQYRRVLACRGAIFGGPVFANLAEVLADPAAARALIRAAFDDPAAPEDATVAVHLSHLAGLFGDTDLALAAMRRSYVEMRFLPLRGMWTPELAGTRKDPRFKEILRDLGLVDYWRASGNWGDFVRPLSDDNFEVIG